MNGIINFFKPKGMTSHDAVNFFRRLTGIKRIGHTGTLDPNVTGVLPICIGKATRVSQYLMDADKEYIGEVTLGYATDTQDSDGEVIHNSTKEVTQDEIERVFSNYKGEITQLPPMYSAVRHKGRKLYELAREGKTVERKARNINIYELDILNIEDNRKILFRADCSKGSYMRTLCHDIGEDLGTYGYMSYLIRTRVGEFNINDAYGRDYLESLSKEEIEELLMPIDTALDKFDEIIVSDEDYFRVTNGMAIEVNIDKEDLIDSEKLFRVYSKGKFIGLGKIINNNSKNLLKMVRVFI